MQMKPIEGSSTIAAYGYDPAQKQLRVRFKSGGEWTYHLFVQEEFDALEAAESKGSHFHQFIRRTHHATQTNSPLAAGNSDGTIDLSGIIK